MKRLPILLLIIATGCGRNVLVPAPFVPPPQHDATVAIKAIVDSNIPPEQKPLLVHEILDANTKSYQSALDASIRAYNDLMARLNNQGQNIKDALFQVLAVLSAVASLTLQAAK